MRNVGAIGALCAAVSLVAGGAHAHGPAPAVLGLPEGATLERDVVRLSSGIAIREVDAAGAAEWRYRCPATWGGPGAPQAVAGAEGVWVLGRDLTWHSARPERTAPALPARDVANARGAAWALVDDALVPIDAGSSLRALPLDRAYESVQGVGDAFVVAWREVGVPAVVWLDAEGRPLLEETHNDLRATSLALRAEGDTAVLAMSQDEGYLVRALGASSDLHAAEPVRASGALLSASGADLHAPSRIDGPARGEDGVRYVGTEGGVWAQTDAGFAAEDMPAPVTCVQDDPAGPIACAQRALHQRRDGAWTVVFSLDALVAPRESDVAPDRWAECWAEWLDFAEHAGLLEDDGSSTPVAAPPAPSDGADASAAGCAAPGAAGSAQGWFSVLLVCCGVWRRRERVRTSDRPRGPASAK